MTVYDDRELSQDLGQPTECYRFAGTFREYRYTSADIPTPLNGLTYDPVPIRRTAVKAGTQEEDQLDLEVVVPFDLTVVLDYAYGISPPGLELTVYRIHRGTDAAADWSIYWKGNVSGIKVDGVNARIRVPSIFGQILSTDVPSVYYHTPCNHTLFDPRCKLSEAANSVVTTAVSISSDGRTIQLGSDGGLGVLKGGRFKTEFGEWRSIVSHNPATAVVVLNYPLAKEVVGMQVTASIGCDRSFTRCKELANNLNFGGFKYIPELNPFEDGL